MYNPVSTLRLQFSKDFTFKRVDELIPLFEDIGVKTIYASPIFKATPGSTHGYDVTDPLAINPEIGTEEELVSLSKKLWEKGIGWLQDIVPNHMAYHQDNKWLQEALNNGKDSAYADFFDSSLTYNFFKATTRPERPINYRRFFTIDDLICLNMQSQKIFDEYHKLIAKLVENGTFKGLRVDHIDGLYDPTEYLRRLRDLVGDDVYIVVEKILEPEEELNKSWPIQGTTGYEFIAAINNLFTSPSARPTFDSLYNSIAPNSKTFEEKITESKRLILVRYMSGELDNLTNYFLDLKLGNTDFPSLRGAIAEMMVRFPTYRFYELDYTGILKLINECRLKKPAFDVAFDQLIQALLERPSKNSQKFYMRLMQFTGPLMAKGVEDTLMYTFNRFVSHNEVGDLPDQFGASVATFHQVMVKRLQQWPHALNATASHDTKRGEDARMRLNVLTDIPNEWAECVRRWMDVNTQYRTQYNIDPNDEYMIYQALIATFPDELNDEYFDRLSAFTQKALREAKVHTRWESPNEEYERSIVDFVKKILRDGTEFMQTFLPLVKKVTEHGKINSAAQLLLKIACPGTPDIYQGSLTWDLSFVDPDNRRPVDYANLDSKKIGWLKKLLTIRNQHEKIFTYGHYVPLKITGALRDNIIAFAREYQGSYIIAAAMIHTAQLKFPVDWQDTVIVLPEDCRYENLNHLKATTIFSEDTIALLVVDSAKRTRSSGVLMSATSLPSHFPVGDIGKSARQFADFLFASRQRIWQMLPVNPIDGKSSFSPYSSLSSTEGNMLLISIEDLVSDGLLSKEDIKSKWTKSFVDYDEAASRKEILLKKAWDNFNLKRPVALTKAFGSGDFSDWVQFIFLRQMKRLKKYCNDRDIRLVGDIPFYMCGDSKDVAQYPDVFSFDEVAGVPPDFFSEDGQLWGMPVFNWETQKEAVYKWWIQRLKRALDLFDFVRLDHFRAFSEYWSVPAGSQTAKDGSWKKGPGIEFFNALKKEVGEVHFIAEDLGDISQDVFDLRDELKFPGMKVLQFAFGGDFPNSIHLPHNISERFVVYPGTHDNNTTRGWYENDLDDEGRKNVETYFNQKVTGKNISELFTRVCYASNAEMAIIPMQDILRLGEKARMNKPSTTVNNWTWRMSVLPKEEIVARLRKLTYLYQR